MQEMIMHCLNPSVLEGQRAHLQWQDANNLNVCENMFSLQQSEGLIDTWPNLNASTNTPSPTTTICNSSSSAQVGKEKSSKKRKADKSPMVSGDEEEKRLKGDQDNKVEKQKENKREDSGTTSSKENNEKKQDYIHVRARRGQATDSHSLAERVRRERISERMKYLQGLVPGCNKITGKAGMLDEIINYVQSLQRQVEFLSMKLAAVNPRLDFNMEQLLTKEMNLSCNSSIGIESEIIDPSFLQFNFLQQAITSCGYDMGMSMNPTELALRRSISPPANEPPPFLDSNFNVQRSNPGWDNELHNLYGSAFPFHSLQGNHLSGNLKTEM